MPETRRGFAALLLGALALTGGCIGFLAGTEPLQFSATSVGMSETALADSGYEFVGTDSRTVSQEFTVAGQTRTVEVTNQVAEYSRELDLGPAGQVEIARFAVLATPQVEIAGRTFNPVGSMSNEELVTRIQSEYRGIEDIQPAGDRTVRILGQETTVSTFTATARIESGLELPVVIHVANVQHGDDFVIAAAVHPQRIDEIDRIDDLLRGIEHAA